MIHVLAEACPRPGRLADALACYRDFVPLVRAHEPDCIDYVPTLDHDLGLPNQVSGDASILVVERWRSVEAFRRHLAMPHTQAFRTRIAPLLARGVSVRILAPVALPPA